VEHKEGATEEVKGEAKEDVKEEVKEEEKGPTGRGRKRKAEGAKPAGAAPKTDSSGGTQVHRGRPRA